MDASDLVSIIDTANESVKQSDWFWNASKEDRELYKQYYKSKTGRKNTKAHADTIAEVDEQSEQNKEDENEHEADEEGDKEATAEEEEEAVLDVGAVVPESEGPPPKRERSAAQKRYQDYLTIAREELTKQGKKPISMSQCHTLCKQMLEEDGWR